MYTRKYLAPRAYSDCMLISARRMVVGVFFSFFPFYSYVRTRAYSLPLPPFRFLRFIARSMHQLQATESRKLERKSGVFPIISSKYWYDPYIFVTIVWNMRVADSAFYRRYDRLTDVVSLTYREYIFSQISPTCNDSRKRLNGRRNFLSKSDASLLIFLLLDTWRNKNSELQI